MTRPEIRDATPIADLSAVCLQFPLPGRLAKAVPYGTGHINDTYALTFEQEGRAVRYVLQRINRQVFQRVPELMENIARVSSHVAAHLRRTGREDASRRALTLVPTRDGQNFWRDPAGHFWRVYLFIESARSHDLVDFPRQAYEAAFAFGEFQGFLADFPPPRLHETIPDFHRTRSRFQALERSVAADVSRRADQVREEIDFARRRETMVDLLTGLQASGGLPERVAHNDAKLNNVLLDEASGRGVCVIDLDTVMPGLSLYDFGDLVRSSTNSAAEDTPDPALVQMRMPIFEPLVRGYLAGVGGALVDAEVARLAFAGRLMTFENGLRFLTDFLDGDTYYKTKRPRHNLDRCRSQFALLRSMEAQQDEMDRLVEMIARQTADEIRQGNS